MKKSLLKESVGNVLKKSPWILPSLLFITAGVVITSLAPAHMLRSIIDNYIMPSRFQGIFQMACIYFILLLANNLFEFLKSLCLTLFGQQLYQSIQEKLSDKLTRLETRYYTDHNAGETASYFINDVDTINSVFATGIIGMVIDCFKVVGILASIYFFSPAISFMTCMFLPIVIAATRIIQKIMLLAQMRSRKVTGAINNAISETKETFAMVKLNGQEAFMEKRWRNLLTENYDAAEKVNFADSISSPIPQTIRAVVVGLLVYMSSENMGITVGMLAASIELITNLFDPIIAISTELQSLQKAVSGNRRLNAFYNEPEYLSSIAIPPNEFWEKPMEICFDHVYFSYEENRTVLQDISFQTGNGEKLAIAGRTGVGKTTLFNLITGMYAPDEGSITINGLSAATVGGCRRQLFAYVSQSFAPIIGTMADQVTLFDDCVNDDMVIAAMKAVGLHEEILALPEGYHTQYKKGVLSEGQEQLLNIARAIVMKPQIFLLDEMSAQLDSLSEARIQKALETAGRDMTTISISHRLSSILYADRLLYIKEGAIDRALDLKNNSEDRQWVIDTANMQQYAN